MSIQKKNVQKQKSVKSNDENILVVKRNHMFPTGSWNGIKKTKDSLFVETIFEKKEFLPRSLMEHDPSYKQIIPYLIFNHEDRYFLMQRKAKASEKRLRSKYSLGIGGHIRQEDIQDADIYSWAKREFHEEVDYQGNVAVEFLGILNDDTNDVGKVHVGFVYLLKGDSSEISVKDELQSGDLLTLYECEDLYQHMENWSQIVFDFLSK